MPNLVMESSDEAQVRRSVIPADASTTNYLSVGQLWPRPSGHEKLPVRNLVSVTTASLASDVSEQTVLVLPRGFLLYKIVTSRPARVRIYFTVDQQLADLSRPAATLPSGDHGIIFEYVTTEDNLSAALSPLVYGANLDSAGAVPVTITNFDTSVGTVTLTLTYIRME